MERDKKKNELLNFIREYRFVREEELMFHIRASMKKFAVHMKSWN